MGFLSKIKNKMRKRVSKMPSRGRRPVLTGLRNTNRRNIGSGLIFGRGPRGNMGSDFRMPIKRGGFGGGFGGSLREAIRRLQEKRDMGMPRMEGNIGRLPGMGMIGTPQPIPERMPTDPSSYFNPTIFGQPIPQGADFSNMPDFSQIDMSQLNIPTLPREISQMNIPQMPEGLPSMEEIETAPRMPQMRMGDMQPRMMMQAGDEVSPEQEIFSLQAQLKNLEEQLRLDRSYNDDQAVINTSAEMAAIQERMRELLSDSNVREIMGESGRTISNSFMDMDGGRTMSDIDRQMGFKAAGSIGLDDQGNPVFPEYAGGGYVNGYAEGDEVMMMEGNEIESMLSGMDSEESGAMDELEQMAPEMEMIDQLVMMVAQMIQQGAGEEEVIMFLREQGLDDEDIGTVLQLVAEMSETEEMAEDQIGNELAQLG